MDTNGSAGRTALVTGGSRGIGRAIVDTLAAEGFAVVVLDLLGDLAHEAAAAVEAGGGHALAVEADVADSAAVAAAVDAAEGRFGHIDALVNNAGWDDMMAFVDTDEAFWDHVIEINFKGPLRTMHRLLPGMLERRWGRIVNVASDAGRVGSSHEAVYSGAKGGLIALTKAIARESARHGVTANCVCPGPVDTPSFQQLVEARGDGIMSAMVRAVPMKRIGQPQDIAAAVRLFTAEGAGYITGQTLSVSGGLTMA
jgi:2-hydroxycyclohexanecarboxyl-CoA dehydrogenase